MIRTACACLGVAAVLLTGCSATDGDTEPQPSRSAFGAGAAPSPVLPGRPSTPADVAARFRLAGLPVEEYQEQGKDRDPDGLLGRPFGYLARGSFTIPGANAAAPVGSVDRGAVIEVWPEPAGAQRRSDTIQKNLADAPLRGTEYHFLAGPVLVRISGRISAPLAKEYEAALH